MRLVVDREADEQYIHRIIPSPTLSNTLNRCLQLSETHSIGLLNEMRDVMQSINAAQTRLIAHRQAQAACLNRRGMGRKRRKINTEESQTSEESQSTGDGIEEGLRGGPVASDFHDMGGERSMAGMLGTVLVQSLVRIGRDRWTSTRTRGRGRLSYNRIEVSPLPVTLAKIELIFLAMR